MRCNGRLRMWTTVAAAAGLALAAGCGGGSAKGPKTAKTAAGTTLRTAGGAAITVEAHNHWMAGIRRFNAYEKEGWNAARCDEVVGSFESAVKAQQGGKFAEALFMAGLAASRCNDQSKAKSYYEKALAKNDKFCKARVGIGVMQLEAGDRKEAFKTFQQAVRDDPQCAEGYVNVAIMQRMMGGKNVDEARVNLRRALAIDSQYLPAFAELALLFYEQGARKEEQYDLAEVVCRQAQLLDRNYAPIYNTWGLIKMAKGDLINALRFFERARDLDSNIFEAHMNFGEITISFRGYSDARAAFGKAVELQPGSYEAHLGLGAALRGLEQYDQAEAMYKKAIGIDSKRPEAYYNLGLIYQDYKTGLIPDMEKAKKFYKDFLDRAGKKPKYTEEVQGLTRRCKIDQGDKKRRRIGVKRDCRPGRLQNMDMAIEALREMEAMQREAEAAQREMERQMKGQ
jgi:tetratricopeptide (TPR) repeat protein